MGRVPRRLVSAVAVTGALLALPWGAGQQIPMAVHAQSVAGFGPSTVVDPQRTGGEPDIKVCGVSATWSYGTCGQNNPYVSAPWGFSTSSSFVWRSEDGGHTFKLTPSNDTTGKPDACPGGGDTDLAVQPGRFQSRDYLNFIDLQGLTNFSAGVSKDGGQSRTCNPASSEATVVDRQWFGIYKDPSGAPGNGARVYLDYDQVAGAQCQGQQGADGNAFVVQTSTDGGLTYAPPVIADCNDGIAGPMQVNQKTGEIFAIHTAYSTPTGQYTSVAADAVTVDYSIDGGATWTASPVFGCIPQGSGGQVTSDCTTGEDFAVLAMDTAGGLYAVWAQAPTDGSANVTGPSQIFYSYSGDNAKTWSTPVQMDAGASTNLDLFPWVVAGNPGAIDIVWYGTTKDPSVGWDPGSQITDWNVYMTQSFNANSGTPSFSAPVQVSQHPNHNGGICTMGLGCTTGGDRSLVDFFQVNLNKQGAAVVTWADTSNNGNTSQSGDAAALIMEAQQISGPTLLGGTLSGSLNICTSVTGKPCQKDIKGDARYEANGLIEPNVPKLDITGSSLNLQPKNPTTLDVRMNLAGLTSLPNATDPNILDPYVDYLTSWNYHIPGNGQQQYDSTGNIYYAYLEVNRATGAVAAYDGNTCSIASTHPKYLVYPGQNAIQYKLNFKQKTIDLYVPLADVGNPPPGATLYSVTAHTVGEPAPAGPYTCTTRDPNGNNNDPSGQIFNVYDKSPAYTSVLTPHTVAKRRRK